MKMSAISLDPRSSEACKGCPAELVDWPDGQNSSATAFGLRCAEQMNSWAGLAVKKSEQRPRIDLAVEKCD